MGRDLKGLLKEWQITDPPPEVDARIVATYAEMQRRSASGWMRSVRLPAPVFALLVVAQVLSMAVIGHFLVSTSPPPPVVAMPERVVEVPVVRERTITQVVYLPVEAEIGSRQRAAHTTDAEPDTNPAMDLTGFRPVSELQLRVIKGENKNER